MSDELDPIHPDAPLSEVRRADVARRILVVHCHPVAESFVSAVHRRVIAVLRARGHEVRCIDLYAEDFAPVLTFDEWSLHRLGVERKPWAQEHGALLQWADGLVFTYPTWFGCQPAMLKGWLDRIWVADVAFRFLDDGANIRGALGNIRSIHAITTHGSGKLANVLQGEPGKRVLLRGLRSLFAPRSRSSWVAFYGNDRATPTDRTAFLERVERAMARV